MQKCEDSFLDAVTQDSAIKETEQAFADVLVGPHKANVNFKLDTEASANVIPTNVLKRLGIQVMGLSGFLSKASATSNLSTKTFS